MQFVLTCEVSPTSAFGLPDGEVLVMPAPGGHFRGPTVHSASGVRVHLGTLSRYRCLESRFDTAFAVGAAQARFMDNALEIRFEASDRSVALEVGQALVDRLLQHLALEHGRYFSAAPRILEDAGGTLIPLPIVVWQGTVTVFDLDALRQQVEAAAPRAHLSDKVLDKSLEYYEHALYLAASVPTNSPIAERTVRHLLAAAFLFLWKALSAVVGDPNVDRLDYQSRYRKLCLDHTFFRDTIEEIRRLRNDEDVAHYRIDDGGLEVVRQKFAMAKASVKQVVVAYAEHLRAGKESFGP